MIKINLVVSHNKAHYQVWLQDLGLSSHDYKYISKFEDIIRIEKAKIFLIGDYWLNPVYGSRRFEIVKNLPDVELVYE